MSQGKGRGTVMFLPCRKKDKSQCHSQSLCGPLSSHPQQTPGEKSKTFWEQHTPWAARELIAWVMGTYGDSNHV